MVASSSRRKKPRRSKKFRGHIPKEVLYKIFYRLPTIQPVYRFRCVSKLWNSLLSEPSFINKIFNKISSTPWIFMYDPSCRQGQLYLNHDEKFINHHDGLSFDFLLDTYPIRRQKLKYVCLLDSCSNGLVLYSARPLAEFPSQKDDDVDTRFYICNPLTKQWASLTRRPCNDYQHYYLLGIKLVCDTICNYKVVFIYYYTAGNSFDLTFQIFSCDTGEWITSRVPEIPEMANDFSEMVIRHSVLYWKARVSVRGSDENYLCLIAYSLENKENSVSDRCRPIDIPKMSDGSIKNRFLGESEGSIYYGHIIIFHIDNHRTPFKALLNVWKLEDDYANGGPNLQMVHKNVELKGYRPSSTEIEGIYICPVDRNVIIIVDRGCCLAYNIATLTYEALHGGPIPTKLRNYKLPRILITPKPTVIPSLKR